MDALQIVFLLTSLVILAASVAVVTVRNLIHAALSLIVALFGVAVLFVLLEAGFLAAVQVVLYIGAIAILIIFAIMLTRRVMQDTSTQTNAMWWVSAVMAVVLMAALAWLFMPGMSPLTFAITPLVPPADSLARLGASFVDPNQYALPFEVASILLLMAMVGSIVIAGEKK